MPSSAAILRITLLTSVLIAYGAARAGEDNGAAMPATLAHATTGRLPADADDNFPQAGQDTPIEILLVTGDGQQAGVADRVVACVERHAECNP